MDLRTTTVELLESLDALSGNRLTRQHDLGLLIDLAEDHQLRPVLDELSFNAKFVSKTFGLMKRIGATGEAYNRLSTEFTQSLTKIQNLVKVILAGASDEQTRLKFSTTYLEMTSESLEQLLALCHDLGWYKNWLNDHRHSR
jgi:hypothetical protein